MANAGNAAPIVILAVIAFSLNVSGLELIVEEDIDLNREFMIMGIGNLVSGLVGGIAGFHTISLSSLNHRLSDSSRLAALIPAALCAAAAFWGASLLAYVPRLVLGGLLLFLGLSFLFEWIVQARSRFSRFEYAIILLILVVIASFGFLAGVAAGLVAAVVLFVVNYSRVNVVKHTLSGATYQSRVKRGRHQRQALQQQGEQIRNGLNEETGVVQIFPDLDRGVEWCEENILRAAAGGSEAKTLSDQLAEILRVDDKVAALLGYLERQNVEPGRYLMRQGDVCDNVYFVEAGQVTAQLEPADQAPIRLETMGGGHVVGEIGNWRLANL